jgi:hypothetical protein
MDMPHGRADVTRHTDKHLSRACACQCQRSVNKDPDVEDFNEHCCFASQQPPLMNEMSEVVVRRSCVSTQLAPDRVRPRLSAK